MRFMTPSRSSSRNWAVSTFSLTPGNSSRIPEKRRGPKDKCQTISTFHFPASTFEVAYTGHPKWFFICLPFFWKYGPDTTDLQNCAYFRKCPSWAIFDNAWEPYVGVIIISGAKHGNQALFGADETASERPLRGFRQQAQCKRDPQKHDARFLRS